MTDKQPEALPMALYWANALESDARFHESSPAYSNAWHLAQNAKNAAALLRTQHAAIERKDALLRQALGAMKAFDYDKRLAAIAAITKELSQ